MGSIQVQETRSEWSGLTVWVVRSHGPSGPGPRGPRAKMSAIPTRDMWSERMDVLARVLQFDWIIKWSEIIYEKSRIFIFRIRFEIQHTDIFPRNPNKNQTR